jgi:hypothetical protein
MEEQHPLFPSGPWEGFYLYHGQAEQHRMSCTLSFIGGQVSGTGADNIDFFTWTGTYDKEAMRCSLRKIYPNHVIYYEGHVDENGIWGTWHDGFSWGNKGGFHLWPNSAKAEETLAEVNEISLANG